ncbi:MAG TPA: methylated-DNA--[protein]-cysteine S-methyltransferase [Rhodospirillales bacterium]|nr:methylated-DNA--[protein]-cysteine S-methyltransferase [Rhodospirillales bacterium]HJO68653.1 methylated-DNA--[protein]-cysteine S-methyltransferase [Rhodospirillales bacterium]
MRHTAILSPLGPLTVFEDEGALVAIEWGRGAGGASSPLLEDAARQLNAYFDARLEVFSLPLAPRGTPFQQKLWKQLSSIPFGEVRSYGELAHLLGVSARAVGGGCGANPIAVVIPCHRVIGAGERLGGYSGGDGPATKRALLALEGVSLERGGAG